ncbi:MULTISPECIES: winged helix DNA-binding protein [Halobacterium]|uniref:winged helix DNA-binding protein n=1 Tax=Halobacterium TaxID=2239 RepID=UPI0018D2014F|nr:MULTISPECIES: winged helix DNA-binding protein [Halobacterium]MCG1002607.1 MarR family transcriptional regulator [Halobacterium noricense]
MNEVDDAILEFFEELGEVGGARVAQPPSPVKHHLVDVLGTVDRERSTFSRRMSKLEERGLLERVGEDTAYYQITEKGLAYLGGELSAGDLEEE